MCAPGVKVLAHVRLPVSPAAEWPDPLPQWPPREAPLPRLLTGTCSPLTLDPSFRAPARCQALPVSQD